MNLFGSFDENIRVMEQQLHVRWSTVIGIKIMVRRRT